ncbi:MAG: HAD family phosphatase [Ignavibacteriae bacterium]|nr:MAG: HAD family phosphatase [Ignavibacteriota bacterium]
MTNQHGRRTPDDGRLLIVDFGNVLYSIDFARTVRAFEALAGYNGEPIRFGVDDQDELFFRIDRGELTKEAFRAELRSRFGFTCSDDEIDRAWCAILISPFPFIDKVISDIRGRFVGARVVMLSNISELHLEQAMRTTPELFEGVGARRGVGARHGVRARHGVPLDDYYFSCRIGLRKPSAEVFLYVCEREGVRPEDCVLFDDSAANCDAAMKLGMRVVRVTPGDPDLAFRELQGASPDQ